MKKLLTDIRSYFMLLLGISIVWFIYQLIRFPILPMKYLAVVIVLLLLIGALLTLSQYKAKGKKRIPGKICILLLSAILLLVNYTYFKTVDLFGNIVQSEDTDVISVIVKDKSPYQYIEDLMGHTYAVLENSDDYVHQTIDAIKQENSENNLNLQSYSGIDQLVSALYNDEVDCIVMNESFRSIIEENYASFTEDTRVIYSKDYQTKIEEIKTGDVTTDTFSVYISGIDTYGSISTKSRSDVNMIVTVNPTTKQILLTSIPRDYYIPFQVLNGDRDKLTHSGLYGVEETKNNVAAYFGIEIPYYVRVNFTSVIDIVNAIGGIEVNNPTAFGNFAQGNIYLNGEEALAFSRERYAFASGDRERGRNQMRVITGIINKVISPAIIKNYMSLLNSLHSSFQTNLTDDQMISLIRMQIDDMSGWHIESISVDGTGDSLYSPIYGANLYMMVPDQSTVDTAKERIEALYK